MFQGDSRQLLGKDFGGEFGALGKEFVGNQATKCARVGDGTGEPRMQLLSELMGCMAARVPRVGR